MKFSEFSARVEKNCARHDMTLEAMGLAPPNAVTFDAHREGRFVGRIVTAGLAVVRSREEDIQDVTYRVLAAEIDRNGRKTSPLWNILIVTDVQRQPVQEWALKAEADVAMIRQAYVDLASPREGPLGLGGLSVQYIDGAPFTLRAQGVQTMPAAQAMILEQFV